MCFFFALSRSQACKVSKVASEKPFPPFRPSMRSFEALCTDNFHDYAPLMLWVSSRPASPFVLFLSPPLAGCSFSRLNAAVKPFSVSVGLFYVAQFTWSRPRLARRRVGASIDSIDNSSKSSHNVAAGHQNGNEHGISFNFLYVCYKGECHYVCVCV